MTFKDYLKLNLVRALYTQPSSDANWPEKLWNVEANLKKSWKILEAVDHSTNKMCKGVKVLYRDSMRFI